MFRWVTDLLLHVCISLLGQLPFLLQTMFCHMVCNSELFPQRLINLFFHILVSPTYLMPKGDPKEHRVPLDTEKELRLLLSVFLSSSEV